MRVNETCYACERHEKSLTEVFRKCVICDSKIPREKGRGQSSYCSNICAGLVSKARQSVQRLVHKTIRNNEIQPAKSFVCVDCGNKAIDYDHRRYKSPLDIVPVCRSCNLKRGPAIDVQEFVADSVGVSVDALPNEVNRIKDRQNEMYADRLAALCERRSLTVSPSSRTKSRVSPAESSDSQAFLFLR